MCWLTTLRSPTQIPAFFAESFCYCEAVPAAVAISVTSLLGGALSHGRTEVHPHQVTQALSWALRQEMGTPSAVRSAMTMQTLSLRWDLLRRTRRSSTYNHARCGRFSAKLCGNPKDLCFNALPPLGAKFGARTAIKLCSGIVCHAMQTRPHPGQLAEP